MSETYYLAGPMSDIPQHNFPAFNEATQRLRILGYNIVSPAELDLESDRLVGTITWGQALSRDLNVILTEVDGIIFLPNWAKSRGAKLEAYTALAANLQRFGYYRSENQNVPVHWVSRQFVSEVLAMHMPT